jgi:Bacterial TniB protein
LANDLCIPLVCIGTHEAKKALMTDQQLADRFEVWELPPWQDNPTLQQLLASFAAILPLLSRCTKLVRRLASRCSSRESLILVLFSIALNEEIIAVDFS